MWRKKADKPSSSLLRLLLAIVLIAGAVLIFAQRQTITDHISVWQYEPSSEVAALASRASMNDQGRFYFYASQPELLDSKPFNSVCADHDPEGATLGCYRGSKIYIYDIDDPRLDGIREVTAAHEMLHAVYARLSDAERREINSRVDAAYEQLKNDRLDGRLSLYERTQPGTRYVELHAIIGTEYRDVTPELEDHYAEVFSNRAQVVDLYESYIAQFTEREARAAVIEQELGVLSSNIESETARYSRDVQLLSQSIESFNTRANQVDSESQRSSLVAERERLIARTAELESRRGQIDGSITRFNQLVEEYNSIATEVRDLNDSIDSNLAPTPSV